MLFLGLDVSTSVVGATIMDENFKVVLMTHFDLGKIKTFWEKVDVIHDCIERLLKSHTIDEILIEEPANRFSAGKSSSHTINTLIKFNALVSWKVRAVRKEPIHMTAAEARKLCGLTMQRVGKCGKSHKEQVFDQLTDPMGLLRGHVIHMTSTGKPKPYVYDELDSYVIARAAVVVQKSKLRT